MADHPVLPAWRENDHVRGQTRLTPGFYWWLPPDDIPLVVEVRHHLKWEDDITGTDVWFIGCDLECPLDEMDGALYGPLLPPNPTSA